MLLYPIYKLIKTQLTSVEPHIYFFRDQYRQSEDNTSYKVPAIFIEMPKPTSLNFFGRKLLTAKKAQIKIHYVSYAPFKAAESDLQDTLLLTHSNKLVDIDKKLDGWNAVDSNSKILTQQFIPVETSELNFIPEKVFSILTYQTEIYSRHLQ